MKNLTLLALLSFPVLSLHARGTHDLWSEYPRVELRDCASWDSASDDKDLLIRIKSLQVFWRVSHPGGGSSQLRSIEFLTNNFTHKLDSGFMKPAKAGERVWKGYGKALSVGPLDWKKENSVPLQPARFIYEEVVAEDPPREVTMDKLKLLTVVTREDFDKTDPRNATIEEVLYYEKYSTAGESVGLRFVKRTDQPLYYWVEATCGNGFGFASKYGKQTERAAEFNLADLRPSAFVEID